MNKEIILCGCHRQPVRTKAAKGRRFGFGDEKKYFCTVTGTQLFNGFIYAKMKVKINPDDTWSGDEMSPADTDNAIDDFKKKQGGDE